MRILITGGTGSFGQAFVEKILNLKKDLSLERLVVFSRDELKQWDMQQRFSVSAHPELRYFLGDVRDRDRLASAMHGIDTVVHAAALKQVPAAEYNPIEFVKTNIHGAENVISSCLSSSVRRVIALSTDKAASPINLYGATKLCSDKMFIAANNLKGGRNITFTVVRYGNVLKSRGSVVPYFLKLKSEGHSFFPVTHPDMTRFTITLNEAVNLVINQLDSSLGGQIVVPKLKTYRLSDIPKAIDPSIPVKIVGLRPGEKMHEEMITTSDSLETYDMGDSYYIISNTLINNIGFDRDALAGSRVETGFSYASNNAGPHLTPEEIACMIGPSA